jgi:MFS family permease
MDRPGTTLLNECASPTRRHYSILALSWAGWLFDFYDLVLFSFLLVPMRQDLGLTDTQLSFLLGASLGATAVGGVVFGWLADRIGRKPILVVGWLFALPVPFLIIYAPAWWWIDLANVLLGANQALAWSMTVIMKIDLVGPRRRGLALGLNEFAGYFAVGTMAWVTGYIAAHYALRPQPFYLGIGIAAVGLLMSIFLIRETHGYVKLEAPSGSAGRPPTLGRIFYVTTLGNVSLFAACQAGLVNNLNDGMSWGLYPLFFSAHGLVGDATAEGDARHVAGVGPARIDGEARVARRVVATHRGPGPKGCARPIEGAQGSSVARLKSGLSTNRRSSATRSGDS